MESIKLSETDRVLLEINLSIIEMRNKENIDESFRKRLKDAILCRVSTQVFCQQWKSRKDLQEWE